MSLSTYKFYYCEPCMPRMSPEEIAEFTRIFQQKGVSIFYEKLGDGLEVVCGKWSSQPAGQDLSIHDNCRPDGRSYGCGATAKEALVGIGGHPKPSNKSDLATYRRIAKEQKAYVVALPTAQQQALAQMDREWQEEHQHLIDHGTDAERSAQEAANNNADSMLDDIEATMMTEFEGAFSTNGEEELPNDLDIENPVGMVFPRRDLSFPGLPESQLEELRIAGIDPRPAHDQLGIKLGGWGVLCGLAAAISFSSSGDGWQTWAILAAGLIVAAIIRQKLHLGRTGPKIGLSGLSPQKQSIAITRMFDQLSKRHMSATMAGKRSGQLQPIEAKAILSIGMTAFYVSKTIVESKPASEVVKADNLYAIIDAWIYSCAVELYWFLRKLKNTGDPPALEVAPETLRLHFAEILGSPGLAEHLEEMEDLFENWFLECGLAPKQFIPRQSFMFAYRLASMGNDLADQLEKYPPDYFMFMIGMQQLRVTAIELHDKLGQIDI